MQKFVLKIGEKHHIKTGLLSYMQFVYCGMPSKDVFSVGYLENKSYQCYGINLFYPKKTKDITIQKLKFKIIKITPERLTLKYLP